MLSSRVDLLSNTCSERWNPKASAERFDEAFEHARVYTRADDILVWTVSSFSLDENVRGQGLTTQLLEAVKVPSVGYLGGDAPLGIDII